MDATITFRAITEAGLRLAARLAVTAAHDRIVGVLADADL
jgi:hypothetical protein